MDEQLSPDQLREFGQILRSRHTELREQIRQVLLESDDERFQAVAGQVHDDGEASVVDLVADLNFSRVDNLIKEISAVEHALERLRQGDYDICVDCGNVIPDKRLKARPTAIRCITCQEKNEREYGGLPRRSTL